MKFSKFIVLLSAALAALVAAVSCQKEEGSASVPESAGKVEICITGDFNDFDGLDTKASIENIFRMTWAKDDKVYVYGKESGASGPSGESQFIYLGTLTAEPDSETGNRVADLTGTITAPKENTKLTLVYSPIFTSSGAPEVANGAISIDLSSQSGKASDVTFVAYTAVDYKNDESATYRTSFSFATSVLRVNVSGLAASTALTNATLGQIETSCKLTFAEAAKPTVAGETPGTISRTFTDTDKSNAKGYAAFYVAVPAITENANRALTVTQSGNEYDAYGFATGSKDAGKMMNSIAELITTGQRGVLNGQEYVYIKAKYDGTNYSYLKWATQNLAVTNSGRAQWQNTNYQIGDYFQWAASYAGYGITAEASKIPANLVIYTSFTNTCAGGSSNSFTFKDSKTFDKSYAPYYDGSSSSYTKYTSVSATLESSDDVASIVLGGTWRMPTGGSAGEINAMREVTYWAWDDTDIGYYVFKPGVGTSSSAGGIGTLGQNDDKTKSLLFFPTAGYGYGTTLNYVGSKGYYWSGTLSSLTTSARNLLFNSSSVTSASNSERYGGFPVRPVSD